LARWFGKKTETPKPAPEKAPAARKDAQLPTAAETAAAVQLREKAELDRRQAVCDKLRLIALQMADREAGEALDRRAKELDQRAWAIYQQRTAAPSAAVGGFQSDEKTLQRHLGGSPGIEAPPAPPNLTLGEVESTSRRLAARREEP
jgi:hypothetical protein